MAQTQLVSIALLAVTALSAAAATAPPDTSRPEQIVQEMLYAQAAMRGPEWWEERVAMVQAAPERFAPLLREKLLAGVPATLEAYSVDDPQWVMNQSSRFPSGATMAFMRLIALLPLDHAEAILQDFYDKVNPLALAAQREYWLAQDTHDERARSLHDVWVAIAGSRGDAVRAATHLHSPVFIDDVLAMLESDDDSARYSGAVLADRYVLVFAAERPDAMARVVAAAADLNAAENPRLAPVARALTKRIREVVQPEPRNDTPTDPEQQRDP